MPDLPERIVGRAVAVPHHVGDDGRAMVGNDDHLQAVAEAEILHRAAADGLGCGRWREAGGRGGGRGVRGSVHLARFLRCDVSGRRHGES